jgi:integrase
MTMDHNDNGEREGEVDAEQALVRTTRRNSPRKVAAEIVTRLKTRNGRYYLDLRDLGKGREALIPEGQTYATKDQIVALHLAGIRLEALLRPEHERYFQSQELTRTATVGELARETLVHMRQLAGEGFAGARTILRYEQALKHLFRVLDQDIRADRLTLSEVKAAIRTLRQTPTRSGASTSASSMHQIITAMQLAYDYASDEGIVLKGQNPWRALRRQDRPSLPRQSRTDFLEIYEGCAYLQGCKAVGHSTIPLYPLVSTYLHTGGRKTEVLGLELQDIDFRKRLVRFVSNQWRDIKDYDERSVPLWPGLERVLRAYLPLRDSGSTLLFPGVGHRGQPQMITSYFKPMMKAKWAAAALLGAELGKALLSKSVNPRAFRVTYCSARLQMLDRGEPVASWTVEAEMGHNSGKMIRSVYGRIGQRRHRSAVVEYVPLPADTGADGDVLGASGEGTAAAEEDQRQAG